MIWGAALLVLLGLGLFVGGILVGGTVFYWLCLVACAAAGVLLVLERVRMGRARSGTAAAEPAAGVVTQQLPVSAGAGAGPPPGGQTDTGATATGVTAAEPPRDAVHRSSGSHPDGPAGPPSTAAHAPRSTPGPPGAVGDPPLEEVEVTDLLLVIDLRDEVLVVDEHPRYHVGRCRWLAGRETFPLPVDEARTDGFTPCGWCRPDRTLAERERERRAARGR